MYKEYELYTDLRSSSLNLVRPKYQDRIFDSNDPDILEAQADNLYKVKVAAYAVAIGATRVGNAFLAAAATASALIAENWENDRRRAAEEAREKEKAARQKLAEKKAQEKKKRLLAFSCG